MSDYKTSTMQSLENSITNAEQPITGDSFNQASSWIETQTKSNPQLLRKLLANEYKIWQEANKARKQENKPVIQKELDFGESKINLDGFKYILEKIT